MLMYATICKAIRTTDKHVAEFITTDFSDQLKSWWDNILTPVRRHEILNSIKKFI